MSGSFSFVGVSLLFAAVHQVPPDFGEIEGEGGSDIAWGIRDEGGGKDSPISFIPKILSSAFRRSSASRVRIRSASLLLFSRSRLASASSSASVGKWGTRVPATKFPTRCAKLAASWDTEDEGEED